MSWTVFSVSLALHLLLGALYFFTGCPPEENQSSMVLGQLSAVPPAVTCTYDTPAGTLVTGDEGWAPALIAGSLANAVVLTLATRSRTTASGAARLTAPS